MRKFLIAFALTLVAFATAVSGQTPSPTKGVPLQGAPHSALAQAMPQPGSSTTPDPAQATTPDLCGAPMGTAAGATPFDPNDPFASVDDGSGSDTTGTDGPPPVDPVKKTCENGKVQILVGTERFYGWQIGDVIPVTVLVLADNDVKIDFTSLVHGVLQFDGSDFVLANSDDAVVIRSQPQKDGKHTLYRIDLKLQTFVPQMVKKNIVFNLDLKYATENVDGTNMPNWKRLTTPDFVITTANTGDNGENLLEGNLDEHGSPSPWLMYPALIGGVFLVLLWPGLILVNFLNRIRPGRKIPKEERAWKVFDKVFADGKEFGFNEKHYRQLGAALRAYLDSEPKTRGEVAVNYRNHPKAALIQSALAKCDRVLYKQGVETLSDEENAALKAELEAIVPRPAPLV